MASPEAMVRRLWTLAMSGAATCLVPLAAVASATPIPAATAPPAPASDVGPARATQGSPAPMSAANTPSELAGIGVTEKLGTTIPLELEFVDENGKSVKLGNYFAGGQPVLIYVGYYECPMLCTLVLNGMIEGLRGVDNWTPGKDFQIVSVSVAPEEPIQLARLKKQNYVKEYGRPESADGWHFLTGKEENIKRLTDALGFGYRWVESRQEYAHGAVLHVLTPKGVIARYLYGVQFEPRTLRLSLAEAADGKTLSTADRFMLYCFRYDPDAKNYSLAAMNVMRAGGALVALGLGLFILILSRRGKRRGIVQTADSHP